MVDDVLVVEIDKAVEVAQRTRRNGKGEGKAEERELMFK
jgi:hypothetical protein